MPSTSTAARFAATYALMRAAADLSDHWIQTDRQARHKAAPGPEGHRALAGHIATYVGTQAAALYAGNRLLGLGLKPSRTAAALVISSATHYFIDRRWPVKRLADATGKSSFYELGGPLGGGYLLDQAAHHAAETIAAAVASR